MTEPQTRSLEALQNFLEWHPVELTYDTSDMSEGVDYILDKQRVASELTSLARPPALVRTEHPEPPEDLPGGGPVEEALWVVIQGLEAYAAVRFFAEDIRRLADRLGKLSGSGVGISDGAAMVLAWAYVAPEGSTADIALDYVAPLNRIGSSGSTYQYGWIIGFRIDGTPVTLVIGHDGEIIGTIPSPDNKTMAALDF